MEKKEIVIRLEDAVNVYLAMPDPMKKLDAKSGMPDIIRSSKDWLEYNSEGARDDLKRATKIRPSPKQITEADEAISWIRQASKKADNPKTIATLLWIKSSGLSFRKTAELLKIRTGKGYSHEHIRIVYKRSIIEIQDFIKQIDTIDTK